MGWLAPRPGRFTPGRETRYPLYRRLGGPQGRSGRLRKVSPPPGFDSRTVQPVASRHSDYAIPAHIYVVVWLYLWWYGHKLSNTGALCMCSIHFISISAAGRVLDISVPLRVVSLQRTACLAVLTREARCSVRCHGVWRC
jgi:hypothetical protein